MAHQTCFINMHQLMKKLANTGISHNDTFIVVLSISLLTRQKSLRKVMSFKV